MLFRDCLRILCARWCLWCDCCACINQWPEGVADGRRKGGGILALRGKREPGTFSATLTVLGFVVRGPVAGSRACAVQ